MGDSEVSKSNSLSCKDGRGGKRGNLERRNSTGSSAGERWVCPNDRHLALRAKLRMGWSTGQSNTGKQDALSSEETAAILDVIKRAEELEVNEHQRIGRLVGKVTAMKEGARGNGTSSCILCGETLPLLRSATICKDCKKGVCNKCGHEMVTGHEKIWLCKICSETREMWKRSGAWFYRGLPQKLLPQSVGLSKLGIGRGGAHGSSPSLPQQTKPNKAPPRRAHSLLNADLSTMLGYGDTETDSSDDELLRRQQRMYQHGRRSNNTSPSRSRSVSPAASTTSAHTIAGSTRTRVVSSSNNGSHYTSHPHPSLGANGSAGASFSEIFGGHNDSLTPSECPSGDWQVVNGGGRVAHEMMGDGVRRKESAGSSSDQQSSLDHMSSNRTDRTQSPFMRGVGYRESGHDSVSSVSEECWDAGGINSLPNSTPTLTNSPFASSPVSGPTKNNSYHSNNGGYDDQERPKHFTAKNRAPLGSSYSKESKDSIESSVFNSSVDDVFEGAAGDHKSNTAPDTWSVVSSNCSSQITPANDNRDRCSSVASSICSSVASNSSSVTNRDKKSGKKHNKHDGNLGSIEFTLFYDSHHQSLHCTLHHCQDLKSSSSSGSADPYVKIHLLPGASKSNKLRSKTIAKTLSPEFNETLTYHGISEDDMFKKTLRMLVLDDDRFGRHFLGEARVSLKKVKVHESRRLRVQLQQKMSKSDEGSISELGLGKILLSLRYTSSRNALVVGIVRCAHLPSRDANGFSDPYVKVQLKPDQQKRKLKTSVKWKNLNPEFHEEFAFEVQRNELPKKQLDLRVYDKDVGRTDDFIGGLVLSHDSKGPELRHWYDVIQYPDRRHDRWHSLRPMHSC